MTRPAATLAALGAVAGLAIAACCAPAPPAPPTLPAASPGVTPGPSPTPAITPAQSGGQASPPAGLGGRLLVVVRTARGAALYVVAPDGEVDSYSPPDQATVAVVVRPDAGLLALTADGRAFAAPGGYEAVAAGEAWRPAALDGPQLPAGTTILAAAAVSPDGSVLAAIAGERETDGGRSLALVAPGQGTREVVPLDGSVEGVTPAWLDPGRVVIVGRDLLDRVQLSVVGVPGGAVRDRLRLRALRLVTSGDASTMAACGDAGLLVGPTAALLADRALPGDGPGQLVGQAVVGEISLDSTGRRLAAVVGDSGSLDRPRRIATFVRDGRSWRVTGLVALPSATSIGSVAWLP